MKIKTLTVFALCCWTALLCQAGEKDKTLDIYWVDVEGGAATLIVTPEGESTLIDTGNPGGKDSGRIHEVASKVAGLKRIDYLITTHFHIDHFGGAAELAKLMPIGTVYDNGIPDKNPDNNPTDTRFPLLIKPYREMQVEKRSIIKPDDLLPLRQATDSKVSRISFRCVAAKQEYTKIVPKNSSTNSICSESKPHDKDMTDNANSIAMLLEFGNFRFFAGGDATWNTENQLVCPINLVDKVDVFQVTHHGLDASNNPMLVRSLSPTVTVMGNGVTKGCGPQTFATLKSTPSIQAMYQLHRNLRADSENNTSSEFIANEEKDCSGNYVKLSVSPDGSSYTVSIPAKGHRRTFSTMAH